VYTSAAVFNIYHFYSANTIVSLYLKNCKMDGALRVAVNHQASKVVLWWRDLNFLLKEDVI